jgi:hypothetical protein
MAGEPASVCKIAPILCSLFAKICETSCTSILAFDLISCEATLIILSDVEEEYWYEKIESDRPVATTITSTETFLFEKISAIVFFLPYMCQL